MRPPTSSQHQFQASFSILVTAAIALAFSRMITAAEIPLTITSTLPFPRQAEPVTGGVPLPHGFTRTIDSLVLRGPRGKPVPVQIRMTARYADGSPRWVLLDFHADVPAADSTVYTLSSSGDARRPGTALSWSITDGVARIDTGAAVFRIDTRHFRLFDSVRLGGEELIRKEASPHGISLKIPGAAEHQGSSEKAEAAFEDAGPLRTVLGLRGRLAGGLANYVCRMHFYAGTAAVRVFFTLHNPAAHRHPGNIWDLGSGGSVFMEDTSLSVPLAGRLESIRVAGGLKSSGTAVSHGIKLYQDSSGGDNWRSANHLNKDHEIPVSFRGYRAYRGTRKVAAGHRIDGWIHLRGSNGGVAAAVREFWQNFPKALEGTGNHLRIGLWPGEFAGTHELLGGEQKTHEMLFIFHPPETSDEAIERQLQAFHRPLYVMPAAEALLDSPSFWLTAPLDRERFPELEATCDTAVHPRGGSPETFRTKWERIDEFGWRHFGDTFADNERAPAAMVRDFPAHHLGNQPISHYVNEYDVISTILTQGVRRADPTWLWMVDVMARHHADICIYHTDRDSRAYSHGPFMHTTHDTAAYRSTFRTYPIEAKRYGLKYGQGGGPNAGHTYVTCLAWHFWMTGDRNSRAAFLEVADWAAESSWFSRRMMGDKRGHGNFLATFVYAYELTRDRRYYDRAMTLAGWIEAPFDGLGGTLFVKAAARFLQLKIDDGELDDDFRTIRDLLLRFGDLYLTLPASRWERHLEQRCFHAEVLCTCYLYAPDDHPRRQQYLERGRRIIDEALERFPGRGVATKTWVMCFANTGAYQRAVWEMEKK